MPATRKTVLIVSDAKLRQGLVQEEVNSLPKPVAPLKLAGKVRSLLDSPG